jgi:hypothetical protein
VAFDPMRSGGSPELRITHFGSHHLTASSSNNTRPITKCCRLRGRFASAPTYMARGVRGARTWWRVFSGSRFVSPLVVGHVGNTRTLANIGSNACGFFASATSIASHHPSQPGYPLAPCGGIWRGALRVHIAASAGLSSAVMRASLFRSSTSTGASSTAWSGVFQRVRALPSRPISRRGLMSQALSPPDADPAAPSSRKGGSSFLGANVV